MLAGIRYIQVDYEKFIDNLSAVDWEIIYFTVQSIDGANSAKNEFDVLAQHSISVNSSRFQTSIIKISEKIGRRFRLVDRVLLRIITMIVRWLTGYRG